jgi:hypothetical protein
MLQLRLGFGFCDALNWARRIEDQRLEATQQAALKAAGEDFFVAYFRKVSG